MEKRVIILGLGSNIGDREQYLRSAIRELSNHLQEEMITSYIYESKSWGFAAETLFLNCCIRFESSIDPLRLLDITQKIEREMGRTDKSKEGNYYSRTIDIDILYIGDEVIQTKRLTVPHPLIEKRRFVLEPLKDLVSENNEFLFFNEIIQLLRDCNDETAVKLHLTTLF